MSDLVFNSLPAILTIVAALALGSAAFVGLLLQARRRSFAARLALIEPWTAAVAAPTGQSQEAGAAVIREGTLTPADREFQRFMRQLRIPPNMVGGVLVASGPVVGVLLGLSAWFLAPAVLGSFSTLLVGGVLALGAGMFGLYLPKLAAGWSADRRTAAVVSGLPDALELLVICSEGGLALADGIDRIIVELRRAQPELADELAITAADLKILPTQDQALGRLAERVNAPIMRSVVTSLAQTMRYGTPLAETLRVVAGDLRNEALIRMEERVNKLPALMTIPMILFILPTILLVAGGPAVLKTIDIIAH